MNKQSFYKEQAEKFSDYADKNPSRDLLSLFDEWAESKDFSDEDKRKILKIIKESCHEKENEI